jgi:energy-coupling factor transporter ATP-binding protein EcfA2
MRHIETHAKKAFISHSTSDDRFVTELKGLIIGLGYESVFNDADSDSIMPDQPIWPRIVEGIRSADALVVVISAKSAVSNWVKLEVEYARDSGKVVLPILIEDCTIPKLFADRDVIDFRRDPRNPDSRPLRAYLAQLVEVLGRQRGVLNYLPRIGSVDDEQDDEFGFSVLVQQAAGSSERQMPLSEAINLHRAVVITGDPGSGKSTTLRRMARVMAADFDAASGKGTLPILIDLTKWKTESAEIKFDDAIQNALGNPALSGITGKLDYAVFLDGLNEVSDKRALEQIVAAVSESVSRVGPIGLQHLIVTCRSMEYDFKKDSKDSNEKTLRETLGLPSIVVCPLSRDEIGAFCKNYLQGAAEVLKRIIQANDLWALASNAYMLSALIVIFEDRGAPAFPTRPAELFRALTLALWKREHQRGYSNGLSFVELTRSLGRLAHHITFQYGFGDFDLASIPETLDPDQAVTGLARRCGLLQGAGAHVRFNHQLTQEYFNAVWLKETELRAPVGGAKISWFGRFDNSFRILGGMDGVAHLGAKLFEIDPRHLLAWVRGGLCTTDQLADLLENLLSLPIGSRDVEERSRDLQAIIHYGFQPSSAVLQRYLEQEPNEMETPSISAVLKSIDRLSPKAEASVLKLLKDERVYFRKPFETIYPVFVRELAAEKIFELGSVAAQLSATEEVSAWLDDSRLITTAQEYSNDGNSLTEERVGNRAFELLSNGPARHDESFRRRLLKWLERQEGSDEVARVYQFYLTHLVIETSQSEWANDRRRELAALSSKDRR